MVLSHLPKSALIARLKMYDILLNNGCKNRENVLHFRDECITTLRNKYNLYIEE